MNKENLKKTLESKGVRSDAYNLNGGMPNEAYTLNKNEDTWEVYYSERGEKVDTRTFNTESDACNYLLNLLKEDSNIDWK